jgi:hypothetical protein
MQGFYLPAAATHSKKIFPKNRGVIHIATMHARLPNMRAETALTKVVISALHIIFAKQALDLTLVTPLGQTFPSS